MVCKFIVLDLDGTILDPMKRLTPPTREAILQAMEAGLVVILCTGRMVRSSAMFWEELHLRTPIIAYNGAMVKDMVNDRILLHRPLDLATTFEVAEFGREQGLNFQAYVNDEMFVERDAEGVREYSSLYGVPYGVVGTFREALREGSTKLLAVCAREDLSRALGRLRERFERRIMLTESEGKHVEVCHPAVNKAAAVQFVLAQAKGRREEVVAVGDGVNDVEMLRWAGLGVAMGNACERVKQAADVVIGSNAENGLAEFLRELVKSGGWHGLLASRAHGMSTGCKQPVPPSAIPSKQRR